MGRIERIIANHPELSGRIDTQFTKLRVRVRPETRSGVYDSAFFYHWLQYGNGPLIITGNRFTTTLQKDGKRKELILSTQVRGLDTTIVAPVKVVNVPEVYKAMYEKLLKKSRFWYIAICLTFLVLLIVLFSAFLIGKISRLFSSATGLSAAAGAPGLLSSLAALLRKKSGQN